MNVRTHLHSQARANAYTRLHADTFARPHDRNEIAESHAHVRNCKYIGLAWVPGSSACAIESAPRVKRKTLTQDKYKPRLYLAIQRGRGHQLSFRARVSSPRIHIQTNTHTDTATISYVIDLHCTRRASSFVLSAVCRPRCGSVLVFWPLPSPSCFAVCRPE